MTTTPSLDGCWAKLRRAEHHYTDLRKQVEPFEAGHDYSISVKVDADAGKYTFYVSGLKPLDDNWGLIIGDCVHNARCALDHLVAQLVSLATGADPKDLGGIGFPIFSDRGRFKSTVAQKLKDVLPGYKATIEALQPFNAWDPSIWGSGPDRTPSVLAMSLGQLADLDDIDKHRVIHAAWHRMEFIGIPTPDFPEGFIFTSARKSDSPLENGAEIGSWYFRTPLPSADWRPSEMEVKRYFPIRVCLEQPLMGLSVLRYLPRHLWAVKAVLTVFQPVFSHGQPPLRVADVLPF